MSHANLAGIPIALADARLVQAQIQRPHVVRRQAHRPGRHLVFLH